MTSRVLRSAGDSVVSPLESLNSSSSAMNSFTTEAIGNDEPLPTETVWPVLRSSTTTDMSAPAFAASATACRVRASRPSNPAEGAVGGAWGIGRVLF